MQQAYSSQDCVHLCYSLNRHCCVGESSRLEEAITLAEGIIVCKPINLNNAKLEEKYDSMVWLYTTVRYARLFDANRFCYQSSQPAQLTRGYNPYPERFDQMICIEQNAILQNLSEQDICCDN